MSKAKKILSIVLALSIVAGVAWAVAAQSGAADASPQVSASEAQNAVRTVLYYVYDQNFRWLPEQVGRYMFGGWAVGWPPPPATTTTKPTTTTTKATVTTTKPVTTTTKAPAFSWPTFPPIITTTTTTAKAAAVLVSKIEIYGPTDKLKVGEAVTLAPKVYGAGGKTPTNGDIVWSISDPTIAKITTSSNTGCHIRALKAGVVTITVKAKDAGGVSMTANLTVTN